MEVINPRSALLSNYEVLTLLKELESDQLARTKTALRIKKEEAHIDSEAAKSSLPQEDVCENLHTVEFEAIQYLSADFQPTAAQDDASITQLVKALEPYDLTKAEKLQIINLAPTEPVELYVIVEELEDRLRDKMPDVLDLVRKSLADPSQPQGTSGAPVEDVGGHVAENLGYATSSFQVYQEDTWDEDAEHEEFIDVGEGAGVEGDLEMEEE